MKRQVWLACIAVLFILGCGAVMDEGGEEWGGAPVSMEEPASGEGGSESAAEIDAIMEGVSNGPGGAVIVIQDGEVVFAKGYGYADVERGTPITTDTVFHLGSVGKQFTAVGVMLLAERGLVDYDESIASYLPELDWMDDGVTVRTLLHHTSGIMGYDDSDEVYDALVASGAPDNDDLVRALAEQGGMLSNPGDEFYYSNAGYDLLGALIERVSGQTYAEFMRANIFEPLGMNDTFALPNPQLRNGPNVAESYSEDGPYEPDELDNLNGSGSIYSTLGDMYLYDQGLFGNELVGQDALDEAFKSGVLNNGRETGYGFGFDVAERSGEAYVGHAGAWLGFESYYLHFTTTDLSVVVLLNFDYADGGAEDIAFSVADLYLK